MCIGALRPITLLITFFILTSSIEHSMFMDCDIDEDCPKGEYCYATGICSTCTYCTAYRRENSSWTQCPKKALDCGECIKGYESEILNDGRKHDSCIIIKKKMDSDVVSYRSISHSDLRNEPETVPFSFEDAPPPYTPFVNSSAPYSMGVSTPATHEQVVEYTSETLLKAVPFYPPNYFNPPSYVSNNIQEHVDEEDDLEILDENTQPSDWTPNTAAENSPESLLASSLVPERPFQHLNKRDSECTTSDGSSNNIDSDTGYDSSPDGPRNKRPRTMMNLNHSFTINTNTISQNQNETNVLAVSQGQADEDLL